MHVKDFIKWGAELVRSPDTVDLEPVGNPTVIMRWLLLNQMNSLQTVSTRLLMLRLKM